MSFLSYLLSTSFVSMALLTSACAQSDTKSAAETLDPIHHKFDTINFTGAYLSARSARIHYDFENAQKNAENSFVLTRMDNPFLADQAVRMSLIQNDFDTAVSLVNQHVKQLKNQGNASEDTLKVGIFSVITLIIDKIKNEKPTEALEVFKKYQSSLNKPMQALIGGTVYRLNNDFKKATLIEANIGGFALFDMMRNYHKANSYYIQKDYEKAIDLFKKSGKYLDILSIRPTLSAIQIYLDQGKEAQALEMVNTLKKNQPDSFLWGVAEKLKDDKNLSFDLPQNYLQVLGENLYNIGVLYARQHDYETAITFLRTAQITGIKHAYLQSTLAETYAIIKDYDTASKIYLNLAKEEKKLISREALIGAASTLHSAERYREADELMREAMANDVNYYRYPYIRADFLRSREKHLDAIAYFTKALELLTDAHQKIKWRILYGRAISYEQTDQWEKAEQDLLDALKLASNNPDLINYLAYGWVDRNIHLDKALKMLQHAVKRRPDSGYIVDSLGWAYFRIGQYQKALPYLENAIALMPNDPVINDHLGDIYWKMNRKREAKFQWSHALTLNPKQKDKKKIQLKIEYGYDKALANPNLPLNNADFNKNKVVSSEKTSDLPIVTKQDSGNLINMIKSFIDKFSD